MIDPKNERTNAETKQKITEANDYSKSYHTITLICKVWVSSSLENYCEIRRHDDSNTTHDQLDGAIDVDGVGFFSFLVVAVVKFSSTSSCIYNIKVENKDNN